MNARLAVILVAAIATVAAGCGSDSDGGSASDGKQTSQAQSGSTTEGAADSQSDDTGQSADSSAGGSSLSKAAFVKQAKAACLEQRKGAIDKVRIYTNEHDSEGLSRAEVTEDAVRFAILSVIKAEIDALRELDAPSEDAGDLDAILASLQETYDEAEQTESLSGTEIEEKFDPVDNELREYGLDSCTKGE